MTGFQSKRASANDKLSEDLFDRVIDQLRADIEWRDYTAIEELLSYVPENNLKSFLSEVPYA